MANYVYPALGGSGGGGGGDVTWGTVVNGQNFIGLRNGNDLDAGSGISAGLIVSLQALASFTGTAQGVSLANSSGKFLERTADVTGINFTWTYNRNADNPASQSLNNGIGARPVADRSYNATGQTIPGNTSSLVYTLSAVGDDVSWGNPTGNPSSLNITALGLPGAYYGVSTSLITDNTSFQAATGIVATEFLSSGRAFSTNFTFPAGAYYFYYIYPAQYGLPSAVTFPSAGFNLTSPGGYLVNGVAQSSAPAAVSLVNSVGYTNPTGYYIIRSTNTFSSTSGAFSLT